MTLERSQGPVVIFDGVCSLCNALVDFVIRNDSSGQILFAANQSEQGQALLAEFAEHDPAVVAEQGADGFNADTGGETGGETGDDEGPDTLFLVLDGRLYTRSDAALRLAGFLGYPYRLAKVFLLVPRFIREPLYRLVAANRYRMFGKKESCRVPTEAERSRFLP